MSIKRLILLALLAAAIACGAVPVGRARRTQVTKAPQSRVPEGRAVSPENDKKAPHFRVPDGWAVSPENDKTEGEAGYRILHGETGIEMVWVPGGAFTMGGNPDGFSWDSGEKPAHVVELSGFWVGRTEVSVRQWRAVMDSTPGEHNDQGDDHPVVDVSWLECQEFCKRLGVELPTEAQWEYAARGPEERLYPWGDSMVGDDDGRPYQSRRDLHGYTRTAPVGSFPRGASWCGALDMQGNVSEWCRDVFDERFYSRPEASQRDPECSRSSGSGALRALRGTCWCDRDWSAYLAIRYRDSPDSCSSCRGVRVALESQ